LEEIYQLTRTGSMNLTKNIFVRHGITDFNEKHHFDGLGMSVLTEE
jgi:broad specificity phosphatase PhoE